MPLYVSLGKATMQGVQKIREVGQRYEANRRMYEGMGVKLVGLYALMGEYDYLSIVEAPDNETALKAAVAVSSRGNSTWVTMPAVPIEQFSQLVGDIGETTHQG